VTVRWFGDRRANRIYDPRPSAYVVVEEGDGAIAVVRTPKGLFLPGGGLVDGEGPEAAAVRECAEECGLVVSISSRIGVADEYVHSESEGRYWCKESHFFRGAVERGGGGGCEPDHELVWLGRAEATRSLTHDSHRWAVRSDSA
jgi:8-oxo-dGTP diphosphatase